MKDSQTDPLLHRFQFPFEETFFRYGFPLSVRTNDDRILQAARESFGMFQQESMAESVQLSVAIAGDET